MDKRKAQMLEKVKKLVALANSDNEHEVTLAMKRAGELMEEYNLTWGDLKTTKDVAESIIKENVKGHGEKRKLWESLLANVVAKTFDCKTLNQTWCVDGGWKIIFIGCKGDVETSIFFFKYLERYLRAKGELQFDLMRDRNAYGYAATITIESRLKILYQSRKEVMTSDTQAIVLAKTTNIDKFITDKIGAVRKGGRARIPNGSPEAWRAGARDGEKVPLNRPMKQTSGPQELQ